MPNYIGREMADNVYARRPWNDYLTGDKYGDTPGFAEDDSSLGPNARKKERGATDRLAKDIQEQAPTPQRMLFRPRFGYGREALGIEDVLNVDDIYKAPRVPLDGNPGGPAETNSSSTPTNYSATLGNT